MNPGIRKFVKLAILLGTLFLACDKPPAKPKEVETVYDRELGIRVWHDDTNKVTCWIGPGNYTMVCYPDYTLRPNKEEAVVPVGQPASASKRVLEQSD